jgi:hypothetical protein
LDIACHYDHLSFVISHDEEKVVSTKLKTFQSIGQDLSFEEEIEALLNHIQQLADRKLSNEQLAILRRAIGLDVYRLLAGRDVVPDQTYLHERGKNGGHRSNQDTQ